MENPTVTLGGKPYFVPPLVPKQQREVNPALARMRDAAVNQKVLTADFHDDMYIVVYWGAIWPNDKAMTYDQFLEMPVTFDELSPAINVIREQTHLFKKAPEGATPGESKPESGA